MEIDTDKLWSAFRDAQRRIAAQLPMKQGGAGAESAYGGAYQALVRAGEVPQIKRKYRGPSS